MSIMSIEIKLDGSKVIVGTGRMSREQLAEVYAVLMEAVHITPDPLKLRYVKNTVFDEIVQDGSATYNPLPGVRFSVKRYGPTTTFEVRNADCKPALDSVVVKLRQYFS